MKREITIGLLETFPKFEGKGDQPFSHIMEFEDYLIASGVRIEPEEDNAGRRVEGRLQRYHQQIQSIT